MLLCAERDAVRGVARAPLCGLSEVPAALRLREDGCGAGAGHGLDTRRRGAAEGCGMSRRPNGWTEPRACPWCQSAFIATTYMPDQRYCSQRCASKAKSIVCDHYAEMGRKGRMAFLATQDARWGEKVAGMTPLEAYKLGRREGYTTRANFEKGRRQRRDAA